MRQAALTLALLWAAFKHVCASHPLRPASEAHGEWASLHKKDIPVTFYDPVYGNLTEPNKQGLTIYGLVYERPNKTLVLSVGKVHAREYGIGNHRFAMALHSVYSNGAEWEPVGEKLAKRGWYVLIPNWTGNSNTNPAHCYEVAGEYPRWQKLQPVYAGVFDEILTVTGYKHFDALLGFSWGGWIATMRAARFPSSVGTLVVVAPAFLFEEEASSPSFAGYVASDTSCTALAKMSNPKIYLDKLCKDKFGIGGRAALDTEIFNGSLTHNDALEGLPARPEVKPSAWGKEHAAVTACSKAKECVVDHKWTRAIIPKDNHLWPGVKEEFVRWSGHFQVICAVEPPKVKQRTALFWGENDDCVDYDNTKWVRKMFTHNEKFYHEGGKHCVHPAYEEKIVDFVDQARPIGSLRRLRASA